MSQNFIARNAECQKGPGGSVPFICSVPAGENFSRPVTEATHLVHMAKLYALAHPSVTFILIEGAYPVPFACLR